MVDYSPCEKLFGEEYETGACRSRGRPRYPRIPLVKAFLSAYIVGILGRQGMVDRLNNDPALRRACGWPTYLPIPSRSTVSRIFGKLADNPWVLHNILTGLVTSIKDWCPGFGRVLAIDSTGVPAYCNPRHKRTRDQEAAWGWVHDPRSDAPDGMVRIYGWKAHVLLDEGTGLPIAFGTSTANRHDSPFLRELVPWAAGAYEWFQPDIFLADKGYDAKANCWLLHRLGAAALIPRIDRAGRDDSAVYTLRGEPRCLGGRPMEFIGTDYERRCHGFRCPAAGCHRRQEPFKGYTVCDDVVWEPFDGDPYTLGGLVSRADPRWDSLCRRRWAVERFFAWWFNNGWVENHTCRGRPRMELHFMLSVVMFNAMAFAQMIEQRAGASRSGMLRVA